MALQSPGVEVTVIDESFYTPAEPGTTPLIVVATAQDKRNAAGQTAQGTLQANAGKAFKLTSQRDLVDLYGVPFFEKTASSTPIHGSERNEYGLLAAYSLLGVSNAAFIVRADVDLDQLGGASEAPGANPANGKWWVDTQATSWGIQEWNGASLSTTGGQRFTTKTPIVLTDADRGTRLEANIALNCNVPKGSVGNIGDYAVVFQTVEGDGSFGSAEEYARFFYKSPGGVGGVSAGDWVLIGSKEWALSHPTIIGSVVTGSLTAGTFTINGTSVTVGGSDDLDDVADQINTLLVEDDEETRGVFAKVVNSRLYLYTNADNDQAGDSSRSNAIVIDNASSGAVLTSLGISAGTFYGPALQMTPHTQVPQWKEAGAGQTKRPTGSVWVKTTEPGGGARWRVKRWNAATTSWVAVEAPIYSSSADALYFLDRAGGGRNINADVLYVQANAEENSGFDDTPATATFRMWKRVANSPTSIKSTSITTNTVTSGSKTWTISQTVPGRQGFVSKTITFTTGAIAGDAFTIAAAINAIENFGFDAEDNAIPSYVSASVTDDKNELVISHTRGGEIRFTVSGASATALTSLFTVFDIETGAGTANFYAAPAAAAEDYVASNWQPFAYSDFAAAGDPPLNEPSDGQLWYNPSFGEVDIMVHNGTTWRGYREVFPQTDPAGPIVSASRPETQSDGSDLEDNDLWISTADSENFPTIYRYVGAGTNVEGWVLVDKTDQETEEGVLFADARYGLSGETGNEAAPIEEYYATTGASYLDPDAPDPDLYPRGMLLWNLRRSFGNVKRYRNNYIDTAADNPRFNNNESMADYATDRWVTASPNNEDGSGSFGRNAQRAVVVQALKSAVDTSSEIRDEERRNFNLIACPGYPELMSNLVNLNIDRGITAFVVGDTPLRLKSDATTLTNWGTNANLVTDNGDKGIVTFDEYLAVFYPSGFTTDLSGANAVVPSSHMMLKTIALSDNATYPWFAPAGTRRGGITNATSVGFIDPQSGEFQTVALNEGQRDTLYDLKINPITFFNGVGHVNYGQKTRARNASALDRINVARLTVYLRSQLNKLARPYIFEPNDKITRDEIKQATESLLLELVGLRAIFDFAVVCDETNNTPARIDRNELWLDIAIEPVKAIEFIYIPLRLKNTGEI